MMKKLLTIKLCLPLLGFIAVNAFANDSAGFIATGGVQYLKNKDIRMASEDLHISTKKIRVAYEFINDSDHDITETILFPLPSAQMDVHEGDFADIEGAINSFKVWVDGAAIQPQKHIRAMWKEQDITQQLKTTCGFSEQFISDPYNDFDRDEFEQKVDTCLTKLGQQKIIDYQPNVIDDNSEQDRQYMWDGQVVYSWQQTFPAHRAISVKHEYQPLVGGGVMMGLSDDAAAVKKRYCIDQTFMQKLRAKTKNPDPPYLALGYILTTGANWAKPIEEFHLTIDKPKDSLMSLCWDSSLKKISETRFEAHKTNFTPKHDLDIVFAKLP